MIQYLIIEGMDIIADTADEFTADIDGRLNRILAGSRFKQSKLNNHYALWFHLVKTTEMVEGKYCI